MKGHRSFFKLYNTRPCITGSSKMMLLQTTRFNLTVTIWNRFFGGHMWNIFITVMDYSLLIKHCI